MVVFKMTDWLSPSILTGPSTSNPIIHILYLNSIAISVAILAATNSEPKVDVSTVFCILEYHRTGVKLTKTRTVSWLWWKTVDSLIL
jgi:hypothetical protein